MVTGWYGAKESKWYEGGGRKAADEYHGSVSYRTSRIKIQGVDVSGEPKGEAKANPRKR